MTSGLLLVDKPSGPTSHDVVAAARRALGIKKVGHSGTLDPMASGLLVLGIGQATKLLTYAVGVDKTYQATIRLGFDTTTDDAQGEASGELASSAALRSVNDETILREAREFLGEISQVPSAVSAIKVGGKRAYQLVRDGQEVSLAPREVEIHRFDILAIRRASDGIELDAIVDCSSGTYIRALARDLGRSVGVGGHLSALRRTRVGPFDVAQAVGIDQISVDRLIPMEEAVGYLMPVVSLAHDQATELRHGRIPRMELPPGVKDKPVACLDPRSALVAIVSESGAAVRILVGFPESEVA